MAPSAGSAPLSRVCVGGIPLGALGSGEERFLSAIGVPFKDVAVQWDAGCSLNLGPQSRAQEGLAGRRLIGGGIQG